MRCIPLFSLSAVALAVAATGCDHSNNATAASSAAPSASAAPTEAPPKPAGPPQFTVDSAGPKVGWERVMVDKPGGADELAKKVDAQKQFVNGKDVKLVVDRDAKQNAVAAMLSALGRAGASGVTIHTQTRKDLSPALEFEPEGSVHSPVPCSVVTMVLADSSTAVWKLEGGMAIKRARGFAGPDLAMTGETLERAGKACKSSNLLFIAGEPKVEWGLVYDLAADGKSLKKANFQRFVLLEKPPIAGRKVELSP
jgi:biopolymer transport protein ExbD